MLMVVKLGLSFLSDLLTFVTLVISTELGQDIYEWVPCSIHWLVIIFPEIHGRFFQLFQRMDI